MQGPFFYPDPIFGWTFYAVLLGFLAVATYTDVKSLIIPKTLTLPMLGVGVVFSIIRGAWMGSIIQANGSNLWVSPILHAQSPGLGALDGLLWGLAGFLSALVVFFLLWRIRLMRGGDVKLVAALGAWVGPINVGLIVLGTIPILLILGTALIIRKIFRRGLQKTAFNVKGKALADDNLKKARGPKRRAEVLLAYSLPVAVSAGLLLAYVVIHDQRNPIVPANPETNNQQASTQR
jgi:prepilin peptidase CpaA